MICLQAFGGRAVVLGGGSQGQVPSEDAGGVPLLPPCILTRANAEDWEVV